MKPASPAIRSLSETLRRAGVCGIGRSSEAWVSMVSALLCGLLVSAGVSRFTAAQGYEPGEAVRRMILPEGFEAQLVSAEPLVRQPVAIEFDDRGRLWVIQYLQYPNPAGLKRVKVDRYSRTEYDQRPDPPPRGPRGEDRITILEDSDGDGRADRAKDFVSGLNLASGLAFGHGGVFVLNVPYLLFYPDRNRDDVPDGDPEVLLTGFGMEDAHSVANSLTWGPDGWLYGAQGSTVTSKIRGVEFQQGVWRYHPLTKKFELFCEGGGNSWGVDFDSQGELFYSTNLGGSTMLHGVQGAYYWKSFGKHGALHNPYAFGYFDHVPHANFTGGHVTVGGIIYQADLFPAEFRGCYIAGDLLGHAVRWHTISPRGVTYQSANGGVLLESNDTWFATSDVTVGPDGAIYVADWHDQRTAHPDPDATWDRRNGRIYRIQPRGAKRSKTRDLRDATSEELVKELDSANEWHARRARVELAARRDPKIASVLFDLATKASDEHLALEALWALHVSDGLGDQRAEQLLKHDSGVLRSWTVRLLGDACAVSPKIEQQLVGLAEQDASAVVRRQLACTAGRLPSRDALPILAQLWKHDDDFADPYLPLLNWWALERCVTQAPDDVLALAKAPAAWTSRAGRDFLLPRLARRYAMEPAAKADDACLTLLNTAETLPDAEPLRRAMLAEIDEALRARALAGGAARAAFPQLLELASAEWKHAPGDERLLRLACRLGDDEAQARAVEQALDTKAAAEARIAAMRVLAEVGEGPVLSRLTTILTSQASDSIRSAALRALSHSDDSTMAETILSAYPAMNATLRGQARDALLSKRAWAAVYLARIDAGGSDPRDVEVAQLRVVAAHADPALDALVRKHWGAIRSATPEDRLAVVRRLNNDLRAATGDAQRGQGLFKKHCATCHTLLGEGEKIGPDLTHANRHDRDFLLASLIDPAAVIRKEYASFVAQTTDGRVLTGLIAEQDAGSVTLLSAKNERMRLPRGEIASLDESSQSLMPENIVEQCSPQELRDLFAWLQQPAEIKPTK
ncbi:MAG TPA: PVC-type heme-binding CxxCH protein [Pirellulales bacterium]|jgi:putative membrane-bound dehydrogenase-like protein